MLPAANVTCSVYYWEFIISKLIPAMLQACFWNDDKKSLNEDDFLFSISAPVKKNPFLKEGRVIIKLRFLPFHYFSCSRILSSDINLFT